jgi:hypothetical protein
MSLIVISEQAIQPIHFNYENEDSKPPKTYSKSFETIKKQLDDAFENLPVEDAKKAIYYKYGSESIKAQQQLFYLIQHIVTASSQEKKKLNYTLDAAHLLGYHIYTCADNQKGVDRTDCMSIAKEALKLVANAYAQKDAYFQALNVLSCLNPQDVKESQKIIMLKWENYIKKCSSLTKAAENFMYETQLKYLMEV